MSDQKGEAPSTYFVLFNNDSPELVYTDGNEAEADAKTRQAAARKAAGNVVPAYWHVHQVEAASASPQGDVTDKQVERHGDNWHAEFRDDVLAIVRAAQVRAEARVRELEEAIDRACNALTDSINVSGNDARTNMAWVRKLRASASPQGASSDQPQEGR